MVNFRALEGVYVCGSRYLSVAIFVCYNFYSNYTKYWPTVAFVAVFIFLLIIFCIGYTFIIIIIIYYNYHYLYN